MRDEPAITGHERVFCASSIQVVINAQSGRARQLGQAKIEKMLRDHFGTRIAGLHFAEGPEINRVLINIINKHQDHAVLLGGGDGTIRACGQMFLNKSVFLGILPLGTMNLLAHDLGIPENFEEALKAYEHCRTIHIDCGMVNGHVFLCNAVIGVVPEASLAREEARRAHSLHDSLLSWSAVLSTVFDGLHKHHRRRFDVTTGRRRRTFYSNALIIANNGYIQNPRQPQERLRRNTLTDGRLVIYSAGPASRVAALRLLFRLVWGSWQKDPAIYAFNATKATISDLHRHSLVSLDGEPIELTEPLEFKILPKALPVMVPAKRNIV